MIPHIATEQADSKQIALMDYAEEQLRKLATSRGLDWEAMTDEDRIDFVDNLVHEDRK